MVVMAFGMFIVELSPLMIATAYGPRASAILRRARPRDYLDRRFFAMEPRLRYHPHRAAPNGAP